MVRDLVRGAFGMGAGRAFASLSALVCGAWCLALVASELQARPPSDTVVLTSLPQRTDRMATVVEVLTRLTGREPLERIAAVPVAVAENLSADEARTLQVALQRAGAGARVTLFEHRARPAWLTAWAVAGFALLFSAMRLWPDSPAWRERAMGYALVAALPAYIWCGVAHTCVDGHLKHPPYPTASLLLDLVWIVLLPAGSILALRSSLRHPRLWCSALLALAAFRAAFGAPPLDTLVLLFLSAVAAYRLRWSATVPQEKPL